MNAKCFHKQAGRATALVATALLAAASCAVVSPDTAFAIDETRTFTWANGTPQPQVPQTITGADGREYRLTSQSAPTQLGGTQSVDQYFNEKRDSTIAPNQLNDIGNIVPASIHISADGFDGDIPRLGINYTPIYRNESDRVTATQDGYGDSEVSARASLPQNINRSGRTLALESTTVEVARTDSTGAPVLWKAIGTYSVDIPRQVLDHYNVTASYGGTLTRTANNGDWTLSAVYTADDAPVEEEQPPTEEEQPPTEEQPPAEEPQPNPADDENITEMPPEDMDGNLIDESSLTPEDTTADADGEETTASADEESSLPIVPIAAGAVAVIAGAALAGIVIVHRRKKPQADAATAVGAGVPVTAAGAGAAAIAAIPDNPECQLIEVKPVETLDENGNEVLNYEQKPKAELEIDPSISSDIPTIIYFPAMVGPDGEKIDFVPVEGAQYWIAIDEDTARAVPNKEVIIASDDDKEIYRGILIDEDGDLTCQMLLDTEQMTGVVNETLDEEQLKDISAELEHYNDLADGYVAAAMSATDPVETPHLEAGDFADDEGFSDDEDFGAEEISFEDDEMEELDDEFISALDEVEFVDDEDTAEEADGDEDPFAAYGLPAGNEEDEEFDSDFEQEMDDFDAYDGIVEPDTDEFDFEEDFLENDIAEIADKADDVPVEEDIEFEDVNDIEEVIEPVEAAPAKEEDDDLANFRNLLDDIE